MMSYGNCNNKIFIYLSCLWDITCLLKDTFNQKARLQVDEQLVITCTGSERKWFKTAAVATRHPTTQANYGK